MQGSFKVKIFHPNGELLKEETVDQKISFKIPCNLTKKEIVFYSSETQYTIQVSALDKET